MLQRALTGAWNTWYANAMNSKEMEQKLRQGLMRLMHAKLGACFGTWTTWSSAKLKLLSQTRNRAAGMKSLHWIFSKWMRQALLVLFRRMVTHHRVGVKKTAGQGLAMKLMQR